MALLPFAGHGQNLPYACAGSRAAYGISGSPNSIFVWEIDGGNIVIDENDTIVVEWDMQRRNHSITVTEYTEFNCMGTPVTAMVNVRAPVADIGDELAVCEQDSLLIDAEVNYDTDLSYLWSNNTSATELYVKDEGTIWVRITGLDGCSDIDSASVEVNPLPYVFIGNDTSLCGSATLDLYAGFFATYDWSTGEIINPITVGSTGNPFDTISVTVTDFNGCKSSDTIVLVICDVDKYLGDIPNTIIPDDRNSGNNTWKIENIAFFEGAVVEIFDRWGRLIYHVQDPDPMNVWDGRSAAGIKMPMDSYYYVIDPNFRNVKPLTGTINVIR